ncbi:hypothetical protein KQH82_10515 [bacterium]|nr:hypothetical protein [bacterium]
MTPTVPASSSPRTITILAFAMLVLAPIVYLVVASFLKIETEVQAGNDVFLYALLAIAVVSPAILPVIGRVQMSNFKRSSATKMTPMQMLVTMMIVRIAFVEAVYIYGLVAYLVTGEMMNMLYFYAIAIAWSFVWWPTESRRQALLERLERT